MKIKQLNKKESKEIIDKISKYNLNLDLSKNLEIIENEKSLDLIRLNKEIIGCLYNDFFVPNLKLIINTNLNLPYILIDTGAISFVTKGADIMAPGIKYISDFKENELILIKDETHKKNLALGITLFDSNTMKSLKKGKTIKTLHYIGDNIWNYDNK